MLYIVFRYLHFFAIIGLTGALIIENLAIKPSISGEDARNLAKVDRVFGLCTLFVAIFGLVLWFLIGKPSDFYSNNLIFQIKIVLFIMIVLFSIYPTVFFIKNRKSESANLSVPKIILVLVKIELLLLLVIPSLAYLIARGIGSLT
ncbi:MAG: hypothetical protein CMQ41_00355 [Gammaproteobacteria bacterium]|nr:hypothetical protein [Gammaproteobacteria bacterium]|tara:strand:+ start:4014 stop:4451 length:438 start_codon:yes stop_codon:yes gene_type:complete